MINSKQEIKVAINAQIAPNSGFGGVESVLIGLISALGELDDGLEKYTIIGPWQEYDWLKPYTGSNQRIVSGPKPAQPNRKIEVLKRGLGPMCSVARHLRRSLSAPIAYQWPQLPVLTGFYEGLSCDIIHFPYQDISLCALPMIYNPHDLQHRHYPQYFTAQSIAWREAIYRSGCEMANTVVTASAWVKSDIISHYGINKNKIQVVPWAPPTIAYGNLNDSIVQGIREKYKLKEPFALYPAMMWPHKYHLSLLESIALLRERDKIKASLVFTGHQLSLWPEIESRIKSLRLQDQVKHLGLLLSNEMRAIYRLAQFVVIPTLFEAASGPLFEAWQEGVPVACSTVTSLPQQARDAALLFDPFSVEAIANAIAQMVTNASLREDLRLRGRRRLQDFSWERTAKAYRAVYRRAAGNHLTEEDQWLLSWDWMQQSQESKGDPQ